MRVYVPLTLPRLRSAATERQLRPIGGIVFGVTEDLRREYPDADDEELEYLAMTDAARASLRLLAGENDKTGAGSAATADGASAADAWLRVVVAADVVDARSASDRERSAAIVSAPIAWPSVASVHVDGADSATVVRAAAQAVDAADLGDVDAEFAVGSAEDVDLAWYAVQEIDFLLADLDAVDPEQ